MLGTDDEELERLKFQHEVWRAETEHLWELASFGPGNTILDLASGPGLATVDLARVVGPSGQVVAFDASEKYTTLLKKHIKDAALSNVDVRTGDVYEDEYGPAVYDGVFVRWLFCFLTDHESIVKNAAAALKSGGKFIALDYFNYLAVDLEPPSELFRNIFQKIYESFVDAGGDLYVGGKLPSIMQRHGFVIDEVIPICRAARPGSPVWEWVTRFQKTYLPGLVERGYITRRVLDEFRTEWKSREDDGVSFFFSPPMLGIVATKVTGDV